MNQRIGQPPGGGMNRGNAPTVYTPSVQPGNNRAGRTNSWMVAILIAILLLIICVFGGYELGWKWTGFGGNTLWDWLQLLVLPLTLTGVSLWFGAHPQWHREWTWILALLGIIFLVMIFGGYFLGWKWTGFHNNTLWDWLKLLLLPVCLTAASVWYTIRQHQQHG